MAEDKHRVVDDAKINNIAVLADNAIEKIELVLPDLRQHAEQEVAFGSGRDTRSVQV